MPKALFVVAMACSAPQITAALLFASPAGVHGIRPPALNPLRSLPVSCCGAASALPPSGNPLQEQRFGNKLAGVIVTTFRQMFVALTRLVRSVLSVFTDRSGGALGSRRRDQGSGVVCDGTRSSSNLAVVKGTATQTFAAPDEVMAFFNYRTSPFYTQMPEAPADTSAEQIDGEATGSDPLSSVAEGSGEASSALWLRHRHRQRPNQAQLQFDQGRREFLQELFDEASAAEKQRRGGGQWRGV